MDGFCVLVTSARHWRCQTLEGNWWCIVNSGDGPRRLGTVPYLSIRLRQVRGTSTVPLHGEGEEEEESTPGFALLKNALSWPTLGYSRASVLMLTSYQLGPSLKRAGMVRPGRVDNPSWGNVRAGVETHPDSGSKQAFWGSLGKAGRAAKFRAKPPPFAFFRTRITLHPLNTSVLPDNVNFNGK